VTNLREEFRSTAEMLAHSAECSTSESCARNLICRRCGHCVAHCCCWTLDVMIQWHAEVGAEFGCVEVRG
jgi:hypothetical protein